MNQSSTRSILIGRRRNIPWALIPPCLVVLLALGLWFYRNSGGSIAQGQRQLQEEQYQQAAQTFTRAVEVNQNDAEAYAYRGLAYAGLKDYQSAINDYTKALELQAQSLDAATLYNNRALAYFYADQNDLALADYDQAIVLKPNYATAYVNRGILHQRHERHDQAIADYTKAIELDPQLAQAYVGRGQVYAATGQVDEALADFTEALEQNATIAAAYNGRADIYISRGEREKAIADLKAVVANARPDEELLKNKAQSQLSTIQP